MKISRHRLRVWVKEDDGSSNTTMTHSIRPSLRPPGFRKRRWSCYHDCRWALIWTPPRIYGNKWKSELIVELPRISRDSNVSPLKNWTISKLKLRQISSQTIWKDCWRSSRWKFMLLIINIIIMSSFSNCTHFCANIFCNFCSLRVLKIKFRTGNCLLYSLLRSFCLAKYWGLYNQ